MTQKWWGTLLKKSKGMRFALMEIKIYTVLLWENINWNENTTVSLEIYPHAWTIDLDRTIVVGLWGKENGWRINRLGTMIHRTGHVNKEAFLTRMPKVINSQRDEKATKDHLKPIILLEIKNKVHQHQVMMRT